jgi:Tol biopolymer transport system component
MRRLRQGVALLALGAAIAAGGCGGGGGGTETSRLLVVRTVDGNTDIYTTDLSGQNAVRLTDSPAIDEKARWSPDGTTIVFVRRVAGGNPTVCRMNADGSSVRDLTPGIVATDPRWFPDGTKIVYTAGVGDAAEIWKMSADGASKTRLTDDAVGDLCPSVSPDGGTIAYMKTTAGILGTHDVWLMNADGANPRPLLPGVVVGSLAWSPGGQDLAVVTDRDGNREIYRVRIGDSFLVRLTDNPAADFSVNWSPDGSSLLFASDRDGNNEIYRMAPDGSGQTRLTVNTISDIPVGWR